MKSFISFLILSPVIAAPLKVMVIGDSLSEEYRFEVPFSAPDSDPLNANTENWVEILGKRRDSEISFGEFRSDLGGWSDARNGGYEYNWSFPGSESKTWKDAFEETIFTNPLMFFYIDRLLGTVSEMDVAVIFLGGNDANSEYRELIDGESGEAWRLSVVENLATIITQLRNKKSFLPIVLVNVPDVGGTLDVQERFSDPRQRVMVTEQISLLNAQLDALAATNTLQVVDVFALTRDLLSEEPFRFGNVEFFANADPENRKRNLFCKDGFHPATAAQARMASEILDAIGVATSTEVTALEDAEILTDVLAMTSTVDDAYLTWAGGFGLADISMIVDSDGDGLPNLGEYALDQNPTQSSALGFTYFVTPSRMADVETLPFTSSNLKDWGSLSPSHLNILPDGRTQVSSSQPFLRLEFTLRN